MVCLNGRTDGSIKLGGMMSISKYEALGLLGDMAYALKERLQDDDKMTVDEWISLAVEIGQKAISEYADEDDT